MVVPFGALADIVDDPDPEQRGRRRRVEPTAHLQAVNAMRAEIQRPFAATKKRNVPKYRRFIEDVIYHDLFGDFPEVVLWTPHALTVGPDNVITIPFGVPIVAIDGETQLAARYDLMRTDGNGKGTQADVVVRLHFNIPIEAARQMFYYRNAARVHVQASIAQDRDEYDPINAAAKKLAAVVGGLIPPTTMRQAICWFMFRKLNAPARKPTGFDSNLSAALAALVDKVDILRADIAADPTLRRPTVLLACADIRVSVADIRARVPDDPLLISIRHNAKGVEAVVAHLRQPPLFDDMHAAQYGAHERP